MKEKLKNFAWGYVILFAILTAVGILCICFHNTLPYIALGIGIIITLYGIIYGVCALASKDRSAKFAFKVVISVCSIIAGVITMIFCKQAIDILTALMGLFLIIDGSFKLQSAAISKRYKSVAWWILLVPSIISIIGGFLISRYESSGTDSSVSFISVSLGIVLIIDAISNLMTAFLSGKLISAVPVAPKQDDSEKALPESADATEKADSGEAEATADDSSDGGDSKKKSKGKKNKKGKTADSDKNEADAASDKKDDSTPEAPLADAKDEAPAVADAKDESPAVTDAPKEDKPEEN